MVSAMPEHVKANPFYSQIWNLSHGLGTSFLGVATGKWRSGKSVSGAGRMLYDLDRRDDGGPRFTVDKVVFGPRDFIKQMKKDYPMCSGLLWDETGATFQKREWYSLKNRLISQLFQAMGKKSRIVMMTAPSIGYLDSSVGPVLDFWVRMQKYQSFSEGIAYGKVYWTDWNEGQRKIYKQWHREKIDGLIHVYKKLKLHCPPRDWVDAYKVKEDEAKAHLFQAADDEMAYMEKQLGRATGRSMQDSELFELIKEDIEKYLDSDKKKVLSSLVMVKNKGLDYRSVARVCAALNEQLKKGVLSV